MKQKEAKPLLEKDKIKNAIRLKKEIIAELKEEIEKLQQELKK